MSNTERGTTVEPATTFHAAGGTAEGANTASMAGGTSAHRGQGVDKAKEQTATVAESAKDLASQASEKLLNTVEEQKVAGADFAKSMAGAIRRAANEFNEVPQAARYITLAADQIDSVSDAFRKRDLNQLVSDVQEFARRQPTAFLAASVIAGFAIVRFFKTSISSNAGNSSGRQMSHGVGSESSSGYRSASDNWPRHAGM